MLAKRCTKPRSSQKFVDDEESREAFRTAKVTMDNADWKKAHKLRKRARKDWCAQRRQRILQGDWLAYREHKRDKNRRPGWWGRMLEEKSSSQVTEEVQAHLEAKLIGPTSVDWDQQLGEILASLPDDGGWHPFSWEDINLVLGEMKANTSVGVDQVGVDLLKKIMQHNDLAHDLVGLINQTLWTTQCREKWDRSLLALLAKIDSPMSAKDLRPISMSSCVQKCLNKLAMNRVFPHLRQPSMASCCGPGRQASDAIGAFTRLRDNVREWKLPAVCAKLDVRGACDRVHRQAAVQLMCDRTRNHKLNAEVRWLIRQLGTNQLQGCVPGGDMICVECTQGIKQGAPESAELFGRRELVVGNQRVKILPSETRIRVVGANFSFYDRPSQQAKDLLARAKAALAVQDDLLREKGPWQAKAKLLQTLVFGTMSWCAGAVHWSQEDLATANTIQCTALRRAFRLQRKPLESWADWNMRTCRQVRAWLHVQGLSRWSTLILQLQFGLFGHWGRQQEGIDADGKGVPGNPLRMLHWRNLAWWRQQQRLTGGLRHPGRFYADNTERKFAETFGTQWDELTRDRDLWRSKIGEWVGTFDVRWARGRQASLRW